MEEAKIGRIFLDVQDLMLEVKFKKLGMKRITLDEIKRLAETLTSYDEDVEDITEIIRKIREKDYDY
ncbi:MAG: hypothetical protein PWQ79_506 [Thermococcaceae archaeon]|nr:hypothetical protein [Thermococcaceae archaeon]MDK2913591.1 hypothetical protein [Thermococcaceae archaeon]